MPTKLVSRINLDELYPEFLGKMLQLVADCRADGADFYATSGFRSYADQAKLYFQGRTMPGKIVTNARPGQSAHNFGLAVDLCRDIDLNRPGLQPSWNLSDYAILGVHAKKNGLEWGGSWSFKDLPHVQWPGFVSSKDLTPLRVVYTSKGISGVWDYVSLIT